MYPTNGSVTMASTILNSQISNYCVATFELLRHHYENTKMTILPDLCANVIVGHVLLKQHSDLKFSPNGSKPQLTVYYQLQLQIITHRENEEETHESTRHRLMVRRMNKTKDWRRQPQTEFGICLKLQR